MPRRKKLKDVRIGIFGLRRGAPFVINMQKIKGVKIVSVCEKNDAVIENVKPNLPEYTKIFHDFDEFIDSGMDAVVLANYFHEHAKYAIIALEKKIHVLSETTAAPTLAECVQLCRAVEKSKCKYMLAANSSWHKDAMALKKLYEDGTIGKVRFAEAEYLHPRETAPIGFKNRNKDVYKHWRLYLPRTYYNMHSLGVLMNITGTMPKRVSGVASFAPDYMESASSPYVGDITALCLAEMDNGALFSTTGCAGLGPKSKWFRVSGDKGNMENVRFKRGTVRVDYMNYAIPDGDESKANYTFDAPLADAYGIFTKKEVAYANLGEEESNEHKGHIDFWVCLYFIKYLRGEVEPFFNVYRSVALSAAAILSWRSVLNDGIKYDIPDFKDKRKRRKYEKDFISPFPKEDGSVDIPCASQEYNLFKKYNID
ncbi:MAG: Gfo/Idh/MocA family oxidoreductase [Clostridia bacterium]|nr:Gfo/Idh/MocA family oxidoreductase [Clostridia bacterium]